MNSAVCTLFEGHYHYGLAALINSLFRCGFHGDVYAGYRGKLPKWCSEAIESSSCSWDRGRTMQIANGAIKLHLLPIETTFHLTNYKPFYMQLILQEFKDIDSLAYFDPDIIVKCNWKYFESWMSHGVALVHEISNHDMPPTHPLRMEWKNVIKAANREVTRHVFSNINGGFCALERKNIEFLETWAEITNTGIKHFDLTANQWEHSYDRTFIFYKQDQDALNIAAMCCTSPISEMGPEAMDFIHGGFTMSHSIGTPKPWNKNFIYSCLNGNPPSLADKSYWSNVSSPIFLYNSLAIKIKLTSIRLSSFVGRFYRR